jgi:hypothetical protein
MHDGMTMMRAAQLLWCNLPVPYSSPHQSNSMSIQKEHPTTLCYLRSVLKGEIFLSKNYTKSASRVYVTFLEATGRLSLMTTQKQQTQLFSHPNWVKGKRLDKMMKL